MTAGVVESPLIRDPRTPDVAKWFADHRAGFAFLPALDREGWPVHTLNWAKPGTGMYAIRYVIMGPVLMVWGDLDSAVYRWSQAITWQFLASCDLQYFAGKCEASPVGRTFEEYDRDDALADFKNTLRDRAEAGYENPDPRLVEAAQRAIRSGKDEWHEWMRFDGHRMFGPDWYEWLPGLGMRTAQTCLAHLLGIKLAVRQTSRKEGE